MEYYINQKALIEFMNAAVVYFSRTGNTKRLAEAIANEAKAPLFNITATQPSDIEGFDLLILGTPVEGAGPAKEIQAFTANMNPVQGKKAIVFCTCRVFGNARTNKALEKALSAKGYETILGVSKKVKPNQEPDFSDVLKEVKKTLGT
jgi:flavodoxin